MAYGSLAQLLDKCDEKAGKSRLHFQKAGTVHLFITSVIFQRICYCSQGCCCSGHSAQYTAICVDKGRFCNIMASPSFE